MSLTALKLPTETVNVGTAGSFTVRALDFVSIVAIVNSRMDQVRSLVDEYSGMGAVLEDPTSAMGAVDPVMFAVKLIEMAPDVVAEMIAHASGEGSPEEVAVARALPVTVQLDALEKIVGLTLDVGGGLKKTVETVGRMLLLTRTTLAEFTPSTPGS